MKFRVATATIGAVLVAASGWNAAHAQSTPANTPGVTSTEIKIGHTIPYSGPASAYGVMGKAESAFFKMVNDQGGVAGHKIDFISYDDGYTSPGNL
jgi:branched-chain amino acid transport system substrate-binding protein